MQRSEKQTRRALMLALATMGIHSLRGAVTSDWQQALAESMASRDPLTLGHIVPPPSDPAWREVDNILAGAPSHSTTPVKVAEYLASAVPLKYRQAWPEPNIEHPTFANPLIVRLFLSTHTVPSGDTTPWCAAFANWCIERAGLTGTTSAASQSFLAWGEAIWTKSQGGPLTAATPGDVAVFRKRSDPAHGHVGFFIGVTANMAGRVDILGGNQIEGNYRYQTHLIAVKRLHIDGDLELFSIHRVRRG